MELPLLRSSKLRIASFVILHLWFRELGALRASWSAVIEVIQGNRWKQMEKEFDLCQKVKPKSKWRGFARLVLFFCWLRSDRWARTAVHWATLNGHVEVNRTEIAKLPSKGNERIWSVDEGVFLRNGGKYMQ